jgi:hypothetical protein
MSTFGNEGIPEKDWTPWQRAVMCGWERRWTRDRHERRIAEWIERQQQAHDWICFADIADWCARRPGDIERDWRRRMEAYYELQESILQGEFHERGHLRVIYLALLAPLPHTVKIRLDAEQFRKWLRPGTVLKQVLELCWAPRGLCADWFKARHIDAPPWLAATPTQAERALTPGGNTLDTKETSSPPSRASDAQIHDAIAAVYSDRESAGKKPPNVKELTPLVKAKLLENGYDATYARIEPRGSDQRYVRKRRRPGRTLRSERFRQGQVAK